VKETLLIRIYRPPVAAEGKSEEDGRNILTLVEKGKRPPKKGRYLKLLKENYPMDKIGRARRLEKKPAGPLCRMGRGFRKEKRVLKEE